MISWTPDFSQEISRLNLCKLNCKCDSNSSNGEKYLAKKDCKFEDFEEVGRESQNLKQKWALMSLFWCRPFSLISFIWVENPIC